MDPWAGYQKSMIHLHYHLGKDLSPPCWPMGWTGWVQLLLKPIGPTENVGCHCMIKRKASSEGEALVDLDIIALLCKVTVRSGDQCRCYPFQIWRHILLLWCVLLDESSSQTLNRKWSFSHPNGGVNSSYIKGQERRKSTRKQRRRNGDWEQ